MGAVAGPAALHADEPPCPVSTPGAPTQATPGSTQTRSLAWRHNRRAPSKPLPPTTPTSPFSTGSFPADHPFAALRGSDNLITFTTARYAATPLVVRGPGAGAEVTAAGVFGDILSVARSVAPRG